jgi:hypothetical protein
VRRYRRWFTARTVIGRRTNDVEEVTGPAAMTAEQYIVEHPYRFFGAGSR